MHDRHYLRLRIVAALAALQPGIDPAFLLLLSGNAQVAPDDHGLIVGMAQFGTMLGALLYWRMPQRVNANAATAAAGLMLLLGIATAATDMLVPIVLERACYGMCAGLVFTRAMSRAAARDAGHAFGTMFLLQLLLSAAVAPLLLAIGGAAGPSVGLLALAACPLVLLLLLAAERTLGDAADRGHAAPALAPAAQIDGARFQAGAAMVALFLFICATMLVWSYVGAAAAGAGLSEAVIGAGVGLGSVAGALPALAASYLRQRIPIVAAGIACALATLSPLLLTAGLGAPGFVAVMLLFNIGSTYAVIRASALAVELNATGANRRAVAALHPSAMTAGPLIGYVAFRVADDAGWIVATSLCVIGAVAALALVPAAITPRSAAAA